MAESIDSRIKALRIRRGTFKSQLTQYKKLFSEDIVHQNLVKLQLKTDKIEQQFLEFEKIQSELEILLDDEACIDERIEIEEDYFEYLSRAHIILRTRESASTSSPSNIVPAHATIHTQVASNESSTIPAASVQQSTENALISQIRLPTMSVPTFSGSFEDWPSFNSTFKSIIHNNTTLHASQKLAYLRSCLTGKAAEKIQSIEITDENYAVAWSILERNYDNPFVVIQKRIKGLVELPSCSNASHGTFEELVDTATMHYRSLQALKRPFLEYFPMYLIISKLDEKTRIKWIEHIEGLETPSVDKLLDFLQDHRIILATARSKPDDTATHHKPIAHVQQNTHTQSRVNYEPRSYNQHNFAVNTYQTHCALCKQSHYTQSCEKLKTATVSERSEIVKAAGLCYNCLRANHSANECRATTCKVCNHRHHTLIHVSPEKSSKPTQASVASMTASICSQVLLSTAIVYMIDANDQSQSCRILLDSGSQMHCITEQMATKLGLKRKLINVPVSGINQNTTRIKHSVDTILQSRINDFHINISLLVLPKITAAMPSQHITRNKIRIPTNIKLADPKFYKPSNIDALIGAELFFKLLCIGQLSVQNHAATLQKTRLGWIIAGRINHPSSSKTTCNLAIDTLDKQISKFWEVEEGPREIIHSPEEIACELHFQEHTTRDTDSGRYTVRLPFNDKKNSIGESYTSALKRFYSLEKSLNKNSDLKQQYSAFLKEYEQLGHMTEFTNPIKLDGYYLPHHAVLKQSSLTTKLRVVFDGSARTSSGLSLNNTLMVGPTIQDDLCALITRFRSHEYVLTADIAKMYKQINLHSEDRMYHKILWRENSQLSIKTYELNTVTYGTSAASFLAIRALKQLAIDEAHMHPNAAKALKEDVYVDDILTGRQTFRETLQLRDELINLANKGGLQLRQWASNDPRLIQSLNTQADDTHLCLNMDDTKKTLGLFWNATKKHILYSINQEPSTVTMQRTILSQIAKLFDPYWSTRTSHC